MAPKRTKISEKAELETSQSIQENAERPTGKGMPGPPPSEIPQEKKETRKIAQKKPSLLKRPKKTAEQPLKQSNKVKKVDMKKKTMKTIRTVKKNPDAPKAPAAGAYGVFIKEHREAIQQDLKKNGGKAGVTEISKEAGARWKALGEAEKKVYEEQYAVKSEAYKKELEEFKAKGGQTMVANPKGMKLRRSPLAPKIPAGGGYGVFLKEKREEIKKGLTNHRASAVSKLAGAQWKALGSPDRRAYKEKFATKSAAYKQELEAFKSSGGQVKVVDMKVAKKYKKHESAEEKRKKEDDAARAVIERMRAARSALVGA